MASSVGRRPAAAAIRALPAVMVVLLALARPGHAVDGVIEINQARASAGGVTPGDAPGFPVTIARAGSYRLTGSLRVPSAKDGIEVKASNVTIDLNGFSIEPDGGATPGSGIAANFAGVRATHVRRGAVSGMANRGIWVNEQSIVEDVRVGSCFVTGIEASGSIVRRCAVTACRNSGLSVTDGAVIECTAIGNGDPDPTSAVNAIGIRAIRSTVADCVVSSNTGTGVVAVGGVITGCTVTLNSEGGILNPSPLTADAVGIAHSSAMRNGPGPVQTRAGNVSGLFVEMSGNVFPP